MFISYEDINHTNTKQYIDMPLELKIEHYCRKQVMTFKSASVTLGNFSATTEYLNLCPCFAIVKPLAINARFWKRSNSINIDYKNCGKLRHLTKNRERVERSKYQPGNPEEITNKVIFKSDQHFPMQWPHRCSHCCGF